MAWAQLDDGWHRHPKTVRISLAARGLWATALSLVADLELDGFLPADMVIRCSDGSDLTPLIAELTTPRPPYDFPFWEPCEGGFKLHDYLDCNPSAKTLERNRKLSRNRVRKHRKRNAITNAVTNGLVTHPGGGEGRGSSSLVLGNGSGGVQGEPLKRSRRAREMPMPDPFPLTDKLREFAQAGHLDATLEFAHFKDHHRAKGSRFCDWESAFRTWCRRAVTFPGRVHG